MVGQQLDSNLPQSDLELSSLRGTPWHYSSSINGTTQNASTFQLIRSLQTLCKPYSLYKD